MKAGNALLGALQKNLKNVFLDELRKQQEQDKSDTMKALGKKFQFKLQLAKKNGDQELEAKLMNQASEHLMKKLQKS